MTIQNIERRRKIKGIYTCALMTFIILSDIIFIKYVLPQDSKDTELTTFLYIFLLALIQTIIATILKPYLNTGKEYDEYEKCIV